MSGIAEIITVIDKNIEMIERTKIITSTIDMTEIMTGMTDIKTEIAEIMTVMIEIT